MSTTDDAMVEEWRDIPGYVGLYQASNMGRIKAIAIGAYKQPGVKKLTVNQYGYLYLCLGKDGKRKSFLAHRLVALTFLGEQPSNVEVNHKDGDKKNNVLENLEYCTRSENIRHAHRSGLIKRPKGEQHPYAKLNDVKVREIRKMLRDSVPQAQIARLYGVSGGAISYIASGTYWSHVKDEPL